MFFNNTLADVKDQINFCGSLNYGPQYREIYNQQKSQITYENIYFSYQNRIEIQAVDCKSTPLNKTAAGLSDMPYNLYDNCNTYMTKNLIIKKNLPQENIVAVVMQGYQAYDIIAGPDQYP